jgi:predicted GNAT superfamily acetyltransferase
VPGTDLIWRAPTESDHGRVVAVLGPWWGGRDLSHLLPRLFFQHFTDTSTVVEDVDGTLAAFLIGFRSAARPEVAYIHFVGVDPARRGQRLGQSLYQDFFTRMRDAGCTAVHAVTSPVNTTSLAFHLRLGFTPAPSSTVRDGVPVHLDYDGPSQDRVVLTRPL